MGPADTVAHSRLKPFGARKIWRQNGAISFGEMAVQSVTASRFVHFVFTIGMIPPCFGFAGLRRCWGGLTSIPRRIALFDGGHAAWGVGALGVLAVPIPAVWLVAAAAPALRERAVCAAVVVVAGLVPHETFKCLVIAIGKKHWFPPFGCGLGLAVGMRYI